MSCVTAHVHACVNVCVSVREREVVGLWGLCAYMQANVTLNIVWGLGTFLIAFYSIREIYDCVLLLSFSSLLSEIQFLFH